MLESLEENGVKSIKARGLVGLKRVNYSVDLMSRDILEERVFHI